MRQETLTMVEIKDFSVAELHRILSFNGSEIDDPLQRDLPVLTDRGMSLIECLAEPLKNYETQCLPQTRWDICKILLCSEDIFHLKLNQHHRHVLSINRGVTWEFVMSHASFPWNVNLLANNPTILFTIPERLRLGKDALPPAVQRFSPIIKRLSGSPKLYYSMLSIFGQPREKMAEMIEQEVYRRNLVRNRFECIHCVWNSNLSLPKVLISMVVEYFVLCEKGVHLLGTST